MKRLVLLSAFFVVACGKPEDDSDLKAAFATSALKDPSSVQLRNVQANDNAICGEYNSKNSYGAYTGFEPFVFQRHIKYLWLVNSDEPAWTLKSVGSACPDAAALGFTGGVPAEMNAVDMNATVGTDDVLQAANEAAMAADNALANAEAATHESEADSYDASNDAGE